jgi:formylglycine-generating enzyme required for sulfatase activity
VTQALGEQRAAQTQVARADDERATADTAGAKARREAESAQDAQNTAVSGLASATAALGAANDGGTAVAQAGATVAAEATFYGAQQARAGTLAAGAVIAPPDYYAPTPFAVALTQAAALRGWTPQLSTDAFGVEMVEVPPGCFLMGSVAAADEQPVHQICFDASFWIDRYEVTNAQYQAVSGENPPSTYPEPRRPVESINWFDAVAFCARRAARLPTEAEWEYAARGPDSPAYPWGNTFIAENAVFNRTDAQGSDEVIDAEGAPRRPGGASWVGALDMAGNVYEWVSTIYDDLDYSEQTNDLLGRFPYPYRADDGREAAETLAEFEARFVLNVRLTLRGTRGGSWNNDDDDLRAAARGWTSAYYTDKWFGFRCARS